MALVMPARMLKSRLRNLGKGKAENIPTVLSEQANKALDAPLLHFLRIATSYLEAALHIRCLMKDDLTNYSCFE
jgi:hypothetical protein